jgi:hypothetical protein
MVSLKEQAEEYKPKKTGNISELKSVNVNLEIVEKTLTDKDGKEFTLKVIEVNGQEYRVPLTVIKQLNVMMKEKPSMTKFKVAKSGEGLNTEYNVIPLD